MKKVTATTLLCLLLMGASFLMAQTPVYNGIIYVTPTGAGDHSGHSWANATSSIDTAQILAQEHHAVVWVAAGTYYGDTTSSNAFTIHDGVSVYGGFAGNEASNYDLSLRDFETNETILDGQNARRVLYQPSSSDTWAVWDGFTIQNGQISGNGGGAYLYGNGKLAHCVIRNNTANYGGGVYAYYNPRVSNCLVSNNTANYGGGFYTYYSKITNTTIVRNKATYGSGVYSYYGGITNSIVWGNGADENNNICGNTDCSYSAVEGGFEGTQIIPLSHINLPLFVNPSTTSGAETYISDADWHLQNGSVCINRGNNNALTDSSDLDGLSRVKRDTVDLGCYESDFYSSPVIYPNFTNIIYVTQSGAGSRTGEDWANATSSISYALAVAKTTHANVWVAAGTYYGDTTSANAFTMQDGVNVYGGFAGNEPSDYDLTLRDFEANKTVLDGNLERRVLNQSDTFSIETTWNGFTLQNGKISGLGGGASIRRNGKLEQCEIKSNNAAGGAGVYCTFAEISKCEICDNSSDGVGGGIYGSNSTIKNCNVVRNTGTHGGGLLADYTNVLECIINHNVASAHGGGIYSYESTIENCLIANNSLHNYQYGGIGSGVFGSNCNMVNSTVVHNSSISNSTSTNGQVGVGIYGSNIVNSVVWGNEYNGAPRNLYSVTSSSSAIEGGYEGDSIIVLSAENPPLFVNPSLTAGAGDSTSNVDWHLQQGSPCINRGDNSVVTDSLDLDGTARIKRDTVDLGCYESDYDNIVVSDTAFCELILEIGADVLYGNEWHTWLEIYSGDDEFPFYEFGDTGWNGDYMVIPIPVMAGVPLHVVWHDPDTVNYNSWF